MPVVTRTMAKGTAQRLSVDEGGDRKRRKGSKDEPGSVNPLFIDLVLKSLFEYLGGKDLKESRLVCKKWSAMTVHSLRRSFQVTLSPFHTDVCPESKSLGNFVKLIESNTLGIPFGKFKLSSFDTTQGVGQRFLQLCGETAVEIVLDDDYGHAIENISAMLGSVPNLEILTLPKVMSSKNREVVDLFPGNIKPNLNFLKSVILKGSGDVSVCPSCYEELYGVAQNISTLDLTSFSTELGLKILKICGNPGRKTKPSIQNLILQDITPEHLEVLHRMADEGLKLKQLTFERSGPDNIEWAELVTLFKDSLTFLKIRCYSVLLKFQRMPKLKELNLWIYVPTNQILEYDNFRNLFPILETLHLSFKKGEKEFNNFFTKGQDFPCSTMKSLILEDNSMEMETLQRILIRFPALTKFTCEISEEFGADVIRNILCQMTRLEGLHISGVLASSENLDSLFTGIPVQEIKRMNLKGFLGSLQVGNADVRRERIRLETNEHKNVPSIRNMKNLTSLTLDIRTSYFMSRKVNYFTDVTGYLGFYALRTLRHLEIPHSKISRNCVDALAMGLNTRNSVHFEETFDGCNSFTIETK